MLDKGIIYNLAQRCIDSMVTVCCANCGRQIRLDEGNCIESGTSIRCQVCSHDTIVHLVPTSTVIGKGCGHA